MTFTEPPLWGIPLDRIRELEELWSTGGEGANVAAGMPDGCAGTDGEAPPTRDYERCVIAVFAEEGVSEEALAIYRTSGRAIFDVQGDGPVWTVTFLDGRESAQDISHEGQAIFTTAGFFDVAPLGAALDELFASPSFARIQEALIAAGGEKGDGGPAGYSLLGAGLTYGYYAMGAPTETDSGWSVPVIMQLYGCMACTTEFAAKVAFDFAGDGTFIAVRPLDFCWDAGEHQRQEWNSPEAIAPLIADLPRCDSGPLPIALPW